MGGKNILSKFLFCGCKNNKKLPEEKEKPPLPNNTDIESDSRIQNINLCIEKNGEEHNTSKYFHMRQGTKSNLVIRRGQSFRIEITLSSPYKPDTDKIAFNFKSADAKIPNFRDGTIVLIGLSKNNDSEYAWKANLVSHEANTVVVDITPSPDCIVGKWSLMVEYKNTENVATFNLPKSIFILFNPWCEEDEVFMESKEWREEAVLNSDGMIWCNMTNLGRPWNYAQFDEDILDCALYLVGNLGQLKGRLRSDAVQVTRKLSAVMNSNDDYGVLAGNWGKDYTGGVSPLKWTGSRDILQQYYKKKQPVKFGQCWVFAGILTSACRALGIPARTITNFSSAHDGDGSITNDFFIDDDGKIDSGSDSIWNFHVWSEVWMKRADLGTGYDGWQALDATPQERSDRIFRCGPASVVAVKNGDITKPYDVPYVFSGVNADTVTWKLDRNGFASQLVEKNTNHVGKFISTKSPNGYKRLDVTDAYKFNEGSAEERAIFLKAMRQVEHPFGKAYVASKFEEIIFKFKYYDDINVGESFDLKLIMTNTNTTQNFNILTILRLDVFSYNGKLLATAKAIKETVNVPKNGQKEFIMPVTFEDYNKFLTDNCFFVISCLASVENTNYYYYDRDNVIIKKPGVSIDVANKNQVGRQVQGCVGIKNPLPIPLKKGEFLIEAPGLGKQLKIKLKNDIPPHGEITEQFMFTPEMPGLQTVAAKFVSKQLDDVEGFKQIVVDV
ncbi:annulin-like isoform X1 [Onthophagus taurus]|uniref:annulin-like isoform X1 n=1 Tax=Onthophagus taurus TaxID=166361 RepID=UPI0039BDBE6D